MSRSCAVSGALLLALVACSPTPVTEVPPLAVTATPPSGPARTFAFQTIDGTPVSSTGYRGRMTVVVFAATYDMGSHAQARFLNEVVAKHTPRINALLLVLEPPENRPLVETFATSLDLHYDVVHADQRTTAGDGPFPGLHHVPSVVLMDRDGREVWRNLGLIPADRLRDVIADHDPRAR